MNPLLSALVAAGLFDADDAARIDRQIDDNTAREHAEQQMLSTFQVGLSGQRDRLVDAVRATDGLFPLSQQNRLWAGENDLLWTSVRETLLDVASERAVIVGMNSIGPEMWNLVNEAVIEFVETYYIDADGLSYGSIPNLNLTSRTAFERIFVEWQRGELVTAGLADGLPQLIRALEPTFGAARAEAIGITETTRVHAQAIVQAARANPFVTELRWLTSNDEMVCPICGPLNGQTTPKNGEFSGVGYPPAHVRCRCRITEETAATVNVPNQEAVFG